MLVSNMWEGQVDISEFVRLKILEGNRGVVIGLYALQIVVVETELKGWLIVTEGQLKRDLDWYVLAKTSEFGVVVVKGLTGLKPGGGFIDNLDDEGYG